MCQAQPLIQRYAKRIYGFAFAKTRSVHDAEDLAQDIALALCDQRLPGKQIDNMDAYVYRICCYSWSNFLRRHKRAWQALTPSDALDTIARLPGGEDVEAEVIEGELHEQLRREIMYLSGMRRAVTVMFYYDRLTGDEIARKVGIPAATVRWHLGQAKRKLKERMSMTVKDGIYQPVRLNAGRMGWPHARDPIGLQDDVLMQNICWVCHGAPKTVEQIAQTLGVAAVYLEDKLDKLLYLDYMKPVKPNKVQTAFFIPDAHYILTDRRFHLDKTWPLAEQLMNALNAALPQLRTLSGFDDGFLAWQFMPMFIAQTLHKLDHDIIERRSLHHSGPRHRDGSKFWPMACRRMSDILAETPDMPEPLRKLCETGVNDDIRYPQTETMAATQYDLGFMTGKRAFGPEQLSRLERLDLLITTGEAPSAYDKEIIAELIRDGYAAREGAALKIMIPLLDAEQKRQVDALVTECLAAHFDKAALIAVHDEYIDTMNPLIPAFVGENERNHLLTSYGPFCMILWLLYQRGLLREPSAEERKRLCTVAWHRQ